nr:MAG TPA: hypothetical protein [Caudoviricetes sp.]
MKLPPKRPRKVKRIPNGILQVRHPFGSVSLNAVCALMSAEMPPMRVFIYALRRRFFNRCFYDFAF